MPWMTPYGICDTHILPFALRLATILHTCQSYLYLTVRDDESAACCPCLRTICSVSICWPDALSPGAMFRNQLRLSVAEKYGMAARCDSYHFCAAMTLPKAVALTMVSIMFPQSRNILSNRDLR